jgi:hypothetical protein
VRLKLVTKAGDKAGETKAGGLKLVTDRTFPRFYVIAGKRSICHQLFLIYYGMYESAFVPLAGRLFFAGIFRKVQLFSAGCGNAGFDARLEGTAVQEIRGR